MLASLASKRCLGAASTTRKGCTMRDAIPFGLTGVRRSLRVGPLAFKEGDKQEAPAEEKTKSDLAHAPQKEDKPARMTRDALELSPLDMLTSPSFR
jgi:hypothetical protein